jgi:hypothetical protein
MKLEATIQSQNMDKFSVLGFVDGVLAGQYHFEILPDGRVLGAIESYMSSLGISRVLISKAADEIGRRAKILGRPLFHRVTLSGDRAKKVLPHIYEEVGYINLGEEGESLILFKGFE